MQIEGRYDINVAVASLVFLFGGMLILPAWCFWFYWIPIAVFWVRYNIVRQRRDEALLRADLAASGGCSPAGCYATESGICISDGTHHVLIARQDAKPTLNLPDVIRRKQPRDLAGHPLVDHAMTARRAIDKRGFH